MGLRASTARAVVAIISCAALPRGAAADLAAARKACDAGQARDCVVAGLALVGGDGVTQDRSAAAALFKKACEAREAEGCFDLGFLLEEEPRPSSPPVTLKEHPAYKKGCDGGDGSDCYELARLYSPASSDPLTPHSPLGADPARAAALYQRAAELSQKGCEAGNPPACFQIGIQHHQGLGVRQDDARAMPPLNRACSGDVAGACSLVGILYTVGPSKGADQDAFNTAKDSLLSKACSGGFPSACGKLAVRSDPAKAVPLYRQACDGHIAWACTSLGYVYSLGQGVAADSARSTQFFEQGCDGGDDGGCYEAAQSYSEGGVVRLDKARAASLYQKSCDLGNGRSCIILGDAYLAGRGVPKDDVRAAQLYKRGCEYLGAMREGRKECR